MAILDTKNSSSGNQRNKKDSKTEGYVQGIRDHTVMVELVLIKIICSNINQNPTQGNRRGGSQIQYF